MKILVTGGSGYLGQSFLKRLSGIEEYELIASSRSPALTSSGVAVHQIDSLSSNTSWFGALKDVDVVVHFAARAHVTKENLRDPLSEFRKVNVEGTENLAKQALAAGVRRFVFISSIGVNGSHTVDLPFNERSQPAPHADYAISKYEAELALREITDGGAMELVVIRPPLVYAAHAPGNFSRLLKLVRSGMPLPFQLVKNQRSMIALENLTDFIRCCLAHPSAANETFLISDGVDVSTPEIIKYLAKGMGVKCRMIPVPVSLLRWGAASTGQIGTFTQLCESLVVDSNKARDLLGWQPEVTPADALFMAGVEYRRQFNF